MSERVIVGQAILSPASRDAAPMAGDKIACPTKIEMDPNTAAYIAEVHRHFEDLRQVSAQLAGLMVLAASGAKSATPDHPLLKSARELHRGAVDALRSARPTERAQLHHRTLIQAGHSLSQALAAANEPALDPVLTPLRAAHAHLQRAADQLPGFEMVEFKQGCCGIK